MADRSPLLEGKNPVLVGAVGLLWFATALLFAGPGRTAVVEAREQVAKYEERSDAWALEHPRRGDIPAAKRVHWNSGYDRLRGFGAPTLEDPRLTAWVADELRAPSVRGLEVARDGDADGKDAARSYELQPPSDGRGPAIELRSLPIRVRFSARYEDVTRLIAHIESPDSGFEIRRIQLDRSVPEVRVELDLEVWTHREVGS